MVHELGLPASKFFQLPIMNRHILGDCRQVVPEILNELKLLGRSEVKMEKSLINTSTLIRDVIAAGEESASFH